MKLTQKSYHSLFYLLTIYFFVTFFLLANWSVHGRFSVTGDEPHYLVVANGIAKHGIFEQSLPYKEEFQSRRIYKPGLAPEGTEPSPSNTHAIIGPHGLYSVHNIGLPLLLSLPFLIGGVIGAKAFMVLLSGLIVVVTWNISEIFSQNLRSRFISILTLSLALPLIPASNQIYPDLLAGLICLNAIYWLLTIEKDRSQKTELFFSVCLAFLPWLQIKFFAVAAVLVISTAIRIRNQTNGFFRAFRFIFIFAIFCTVLAAYNWYAFGKISGPYQAGAIEISKTAFMVLLGLHLDQNQGFFLQNPIFFLGLSAIGLLFKRDWKIGIIWVLTYAGLIVPNAMHPNWYGGGSFSGRFGWSAAVVFMLPAIVGLGRLAQLNKRLFLSITTASFLLQLCFYIKYGVLFGDLYNKPPTNWIESYSEFYLPVQRWLPAFYNIDWFENYYPNYAFLVFSISLVVLGVVNFSKLFSEKLGYIFAIVFSAMLIFAGLIPEPYNQPSFPLNFLTTNLPSQTGRLDGSTRVASAANDKPGFVNFGPFVLLHRGQYQVTYEYSSNALTQQSIGRWDIYMPGNGKIIASGNLFGTNGSVKNVQAVFENTSYFWHRYEFRTFWNGYEDLRVFGIKLDNSQSIQRNFERSESRKILIQSDLEKLNIQRNQQSSAYDAQLSAHLIVPANEYDFHSDSLYFLGWSQPETLFRWSEGYHAEILFRLASNSSPPKRIFLTAIPLGRQSFRLLLNNRPLGAFVLDSEQTLSVNVDPSFFVRDGVNILHFELPEAHTPENGDPRVLALALKKIRIE